MENKYYCKNQSPTALSVGLYLSFVFYPHLATPLMTSSSYDIEKISNLQKIYIDSLSNPTESPRVEHELNSTCVMSYHVLITSIFSVN